LTRCDARRVLEIYKDKYEQVGQDDQGSNCQKEEQEQKPGVSPCQILSLKKVHVSSSSHRCVALVP